MDKNKVLAHEALEMLKLGNQRFVTNTLDHPNLDDARRRMLATGQAPHTVVLTCSDSRILPDLIFDQGLGDLFVIRVAGNVAKDKVLGSIEYAVANLGSKLVVILGHESCGAVTAALEPMEQIGHIGAILEELKPAVYMARNQPGDLLENAIKNNAIITRERVRDSLPILNKAIKEDGLVVVSAYYSLQTGEVHWLD